jgi:hypothetical protein
MQPAAVFKRSSPVPHSNEMPATPIFHESGPILPSDEMEPTVVFDESGPILPSDEVEPTAVFSESGPILPSDEMQPTAVFARSSPIPPSRRLAPSAAGLPESAPFAATQRLSGSELLNVPALAESNSSGIRLVAIVVPVVAVLAVIVVVLVVRSRTGKRSPKDVEDGLVSESGARTYVTWMNPCADDGSDELEVEIEESRAVNQHCLLFAIFSNCLDQFAQLHRRPKSSAENSTGIGNDAGRGRSVFDWREATERLSRTPFVWAAGVGGRALLPSSRACRNCGASEDREMGVLLSSRREADGFEEEPRTQQPESNE